ncbi:MAG: ribosome silencing factor [Defluviitaleaceae bacterium]|nr:ribosome silencing factor [Defluviitaleaceae bacterium]
MNNDLTAVKALYKAVDAKFGQNIVLMDLREVTPIADFFFIVTGGSAPQLVALSETVEETLAAHGMKVRHREGVRSANWTLLDFGDIVVHLFDKESRDYYNLERTWGDAKIITPEEDAQ